MFLSLVQASEISQGFSTPALTSITLTFLIKIHKQEKLWEFTSVKSSFLVENQCEHHYLLCVNRAYGRKDSNLSGYKLY